MPSVLMMPLASAWEWFQPPSSTGAEQVDWLFWFVSWVGVVFFVPIMGLMGWFMWVYRARPGHKAQPSPHHNNLIEAAWSIIPLVIVVFIFYWGFTGFLDAKNAPADAYEINVKAQKWAWAFQYPNGHIDTNLHVPMDTPVKLVMSSSDVLHSLYIPAFRVKMDCVPGRYTSLWFNANQATTDDNRDGIIAYSGSGERVAEASEGFDLFCTEYCGTGHSSMYAKVVVHESQAGFETWLADAADIRKDPPAVVGASLYAKRGCAQCHSVDGSDRAGNGGPSFKGHYGKMQQFTNAGDAMMDENYIRESILYPMAKIRKGYRPIMPSYQGQLDEDEIFALIQFIKQLNEETVDDWVPIEGEAADEPEADEPEADEPAAEVAGGESGPAAGEKPAVEAESDKTEPDTESDGAGTEKAEIEEAAEAAA